MIEGSQCVIRLGKPGSGKSLDQTLVDVLPHLLAGEDVYCCYWINWNRPNYHYFPPTYQGWQSIKDITNCVHVYDEIMLVMDSRNHQNEGDDWRRYWALHRHNHQDIFANSQDVSQIAKTVGIVADDWELIVKEKPGLFWSFVYKFLGTDKHVRMYKYSLSWQRIKKLAATTELGEDDELDEEKFQRVVYTPDQIIRYDLEDYKVELIHSFCPKCAQRQGEQILKENTETVAKYNFKTDEWEWLDEAPLCPKHGIELKLRDSGLYDTDYLPPVETPEVVVKYFVPSPAGHRLIPYTGPVDSSKVAQAGNIPTE